MSAATTEKGAGHYPALFQPYRMAGVTLRNRIVMAGHGTRFVGHDDHRLTQQHVDYMADRAKGGTGLFIQGAAMVHPTGMGTAGVSEIWDPASIPSYARVAEVVHEHGAAIFGQLSHLGRQGNTFASQREMWAPSAIPDPASRQVPHAVTKREILELVDAHRRSTAHFLEAGYDGLEVYLAHGYLLCAFLSPLTNKREDEYGGSRENRLRLAGEVIEAVRAEAGPDVPIGIRVSADELVPGGIDLDEAKAIVSSLLERHQLEYVNVSQSNYMSIEALIPDMSFGRAPFVHYAGAIREITDGVPVMAVARIVTPEKCEELIAGGTADFVCLVRPLIADPEFANKAREGRRDELRECISCNVGCRGGPYRGLPIACLVNPAVGHEAKWGIGKLERVAEPRRVLVVGGGAAGLKAAETAALRGHDVTLLEASDRLGGQVLVAAAAMPYRDEFANSTRFLERQIKRLGVEVRTGVTATLETVREHAPDVVVVATGSVPGRPDVPGADSPMVRSVHDVILEGVAGENVVLVDSGEADWKCLTTAERLAADGHSVRLVTPVTAGAEMDPISRIPLVRKLRRAGVEFLESRSLRSIGDGEVEVVESWTGAVEVLAGVDAVVLSWYGVARDGLYRELLEAEPELEVHAVGDCLAPRRAIDAIWDGFRVGREV